MIETLSFVLKNSLDFISSLALVLLNHLSLQIVLEIFLSNLAFLCMFVTLMERFGSFGSLVLIFIFIIPWKNFFMAYFYTMVIPFS